MRQRLARQNSGEKQGLGDGGSEEGQGQPKSRPACFACLLLLRVLLVTLVLDRIAQGERPKKVDEQKEVGIMGKEVMMKSPALGGLAVRCSGCVPRSGWWVMAGL